MDKPRASREDLRGIARLAMLRYGLLPEFSAEARAEAERITAAADESGAEIRDLRALPWASIDNDDSRDLDQLSVSEALAGGAVRIMVAIADVDATVRKDSAIDAHARANTTSVYTAAEIFPMLPEKLSTNLTSLNEGEDRLAVVIDFTVAPDGSLAASSIYRARVHNYAQLAYNSVAACSTALPRRPNGWRKWMDWRRNCASSTRPPKRCAKCGTRRGRCASRRSKRVPYSTTTF